jgi:glucose-fructose oxidoreductase
LRARRVQLRSLGVKKRNHPHLLSRREFLGHVAVLGGLMLLPRWARAADQALSPTRKLGVVLVGLGNYSANQLAPALRLTPRCRLAGVVTGDAAKGRRWAREYGFPEKNIWNYDTMDQIAGHPDVDLIYIVTPNGLHAQHAIAAAKTGKHVICEKPMANTVAECDAIIAACQAAGVQLFLGYRLHFEAHHVEFARYGRENTFGSFTKMNGANGFQVDDDMKNWRLNPKLSGGGPLMDMGVYVIQAACMAKGELAPVSITAKFGPTRRPKVFAQVEESVSWTMIFGDGATADCLASYDENLSSFRAEGDKGWASLDYPAFYYDPVKLTTSLGPVKLPNRNHQVGQFEGIAATLLDGAPNIIPGSMGRRDMAVVEAIYLSARNHGARVAVKV